MSPTSLHLPARSQNIKEYGQGNTPPLSAGILRLSDDLKMEGSLSCLQEERITTTSSGEDAVV